MKRLLLLAGIALPFLAASAPAQVVGGPGTVDTTTPLTCDSKPLSYHRHRARSILRHAYRPTYYSEHRTADLEGYRKHKLCIRHRPTKRELARHRHRLARPWRARVEATPYPGGGHYWAIPYGVVLCESGGDYTWPIGPIPYGGAYGLLASWGEHGGYAYAGVASDAAPWQQDLVAHAAWLHGDTWACA